MENTIKRKVEWVADLSQCIENEHHHKMLADIRYLGFVSIFCMLVFYYMNCVLLFSCVVCSSGKKVEVDSDKIKFGTYKSGRERMVISGNLDTLLQRLTTVGYSGMAFLNTFLTTLPLFTDTHTVMDHLADSYNQCLKPSISTAESVQSFAKRMFQMVSYIIKNDLIFFP